MIRILPAPLIALLVTLFAAGPADAEAAPDPLAALVLTHRCEVVDRLTRAHDYGDPDVETDRYLVLSMPSYPGAYVQCVFHDGNTMILCEAASGYFLAVPRTMHLAPAAIAALGRLGFSTVEHEDNFHRDSAVPDPPDYAAIADLMLTALFVGYGARAATPLIFDAPHAPPDPTACGPAA